MHFDGKNETQSIEEILASIRRLIADATSDPKRLPHLGGPEPSSLKAARGQDDDFELPALFRSSRQPRIGAGLPPRAAAAGTDPANPVEQLTRKESEGAELPFDTAGGPEAGADDSAARMGVPPLSNWKVPGGKPLVTEPWFEALCAAARLLEATQADAVAASPSPAPPEGGYGKPPGWQSSSPPSMPPREEELHVPREMVSCKDTLIGRMGQSGFEADQPLQPIAPLGSEWGSTPSELADDTLASARSAAAQDGQPGDPRIDAMMRGPIDEATAAVLRPLLREWLDNNMRLILEEALRGELQVPEHKDR